MTLEEGPWVFSTVALFMFIIVHKLRRKGKKFNKCWEFPNATYYIYIVPFLIYETAISPWLFAEYSNDAAHIHRVKVMLAFSEMER